MLYKFLNNSLLIIKMSIKMSCIIFFTIFTPKAPPETDK